MRIHEILAEAKQVGVVYHFTTLNKAWSILSGGEMKPKEGGGISAVDGMFVIDRHRDWVSFTRNHNLKATAAAGGDGRNWAEVRIAFDGDKLSNRNRVEPYHDDDGQLTRHDGQAEERVIGTANVKGCVLKVDFCYRRFMQDNIATWADRDDIPAEQKKRYLDMDRDDAARFVQYCREQGIPINIVRDFSRK